MCYDVYMARNLIHSFDELNVCNWLAEPEAVIIQCVGTGIKPSEVKKPPECTNALTSVRTSISYENGNFKLA